MIGPQSAPLRSRAALPLGVTLWILFFCYSTVTALLAQKLLLPLVPALHAGSGLMLNDAALFHAYAVDMANAIRTQGWSAWEVHNLARSGYTGNVALLAGLYALFGTDPALMVPITAAAHATGGVLIYLLGRNLWHGRVGKVGGVAASILFISFPSALSWYGQPLKDGFSIAGALLILHCWLLALDRPSSLRNAGWLLAGVFAGAMLLYFVRPYLLILAFVASCLMFLVMAVAQVSRKHRRSWVALLCFVPALLLLLSGAHMSSKISDPLLTPVQPETSRTQTQWSNSDWLPDVLERYVEAAARHRVDFVRLGETIKAGSMIDADIKPNSVGAVVAYLPRALQISLFAPFPSSWVDKLSMMRLVGIAETLVWYLMLPGIIFAIRGGRSQKMLLLAVYALFFLAVLGFANPNVGTLFRMRYAYLFALMLVGVLGWTHWWLRRRAKRQPIPADPNEAEMTKAAATPDVSPGKSSLVASGLLVMVLTLVSGFGFFLRDLLLARQSGLGDELDAFFVALMIPMFFVTTFSIPLGAAMTPVFLRIRESISLAAAQALVSRICGITLVSAFALMAALSALVPIILPYLASGFDPDKLARAATLTYWALLLLLASGLVITGNAVLNALRHFALPAWAQAVVPVVAIAALLMFGPRYGAVAVLAGMLVGQLANLFMVAAALSRLGLSLCPRWRTQAIPSQMLLNFGQLYWPLVAAALFTALAVPVGNIMAANLGGGSVAALNLGSKIVLFITGLVGTAIATVILPHFSAYLARNQLLQARRELSFFLLTGTAIAIPISLLIYFMAKPMAVIAFGGAAISDADIETVAKVIKFGIIQLPVFTCNILLLRYATADHQSGRVALASLVNLVIYVGLSLLLMRHAGVAGIALAATLALGVSTFFMLIIFHRLEDVSWVDMVTITLCWALFFTATLCLYYHSHAGSVIALAGIVLLLLENWRETLGRRFRPNVSAT